MPESSKNKYWEWSIEKGDYKRDEQSTWTYQKKLIRKKRLRTLMIILLYVAVVSFAAFMFFSG